MVRIWLLIEKQLIWVGFFLIVRARSLIKVLEALVPVGSPSNVPTLIQQFDAVEVQHEGVGCQESPLGFPSALEFLSGSNAADQRPADGFGNVFPFCPKQMEQNHVTMSDVFSQNKQYFQNPFFFFSEYGCSI